MFVKIDTKTQKIVEVSHIISVPTVKTFYEKSLMNLGDASFFIEVVKFALKNQQDNSFLIELFTLLGDDTYDYSSDEEAEFFDGFDAIEYVKILRENPELVK